MPLVGVLWVFALPAWAVSPNEVAKLLASDEAGNDFLGIHVALSDDITVIGAYTDNNENGINSVEAQRGKKISDE
jgi:hypothetical protein